MMALLSYLRGSDPALYNGLYATQSRRGWCRSGPVAVILNLSERCCLPRLLTADRYLPTANYLCSFHSGKRPLKPLSGLGPRIYPVVQQPGRLRPAGYLTVQNLLQLRQGRFMFLSGHTANIMQLPLDCRQFLNARSVQQFPIGLALFKR